MIKIIIVLNKIKKNIIFDVFYKLKKHLIWNYNNYYNKIKKDNTMIYPKKIFHYIYKMKLYQIILIICHIQMKQNKQLVMKYNLIPMFKSNKFLLFYVKLIWKIQVHI